MTEEVFLNMDKNFSHHKLYKGAEGDLGDLLREVWAARGFIFAGLALGAVLALGFGFFSVPQYKVEMILAPAQPMEVIENQNTARAYTGVLLSEPQKQAAQNFDRFQSVAKGAAVAELLLRSAPLMQGVNADRAFRFEGSQDVNTPAQLAEYIEQHVRFAPVGETSLRAMRYSHPDPVFAVEFLNRIVAFTDGTIRHSIRNDVNERIAYLQNELSKNINPEHRRALTDLLMEQERLRMMVSIDQPYAASIVEDAFASSAPRWPDYSMILAIGVVIGAVLGFLVHSSQNVSRSIEIHSSEPAYDETWVQSQSMRSWHKQESENTNERPLTGAQKKPPSASDAAE